MSDQTPPRVSLVPVAGWPGEDGRIAELVVWHQGYTLTSATHMNREEIQAIVNAAAQFGIVAECACRDDD